MTADPKLLQLAEHFPLNPKRHATWKLRGKGGIYTHDGQPATLELLARHVGAPRADGVDQVTKPMGYLPTIINADGHALTNVGMIDLDGKRSAAELEQAKQSLLNLQEVAEGLRFHRATAYEASHSGQGYHAFIWTPEPLPFIEMAELLLGWARMADLPNAESIERFPRGDDPLSVWYRTPYAGAAKDPEGTGRTFLSDIDGQPIPYGELDQYIDASHATEAVVLTLRDAGAVTASPPADSTPSTGNLDGSDLGKLQEALLSPPEGFERHFSALAALNVAERMGRRADLAAFLKSDELRAAWVKDASRDSEEWAQELDRLLKAKEPANGRKYGIRYLNLQGFKIPRLKLSQGPVPTLADALEGLDDTNADPVEARHNVFQAVMVSELDAVDKTSELKSLAKRIGSTFTAVQKAYQEFVRDSKPRKQPRSSAGIYAIHNGALSRVEEAGARDDTQEIYHPLGNFTARIISEALKNDGQTVTRHFDIEVTTAKGRKLPVARVPADRFSAMQWVNEYGTDAIIYAGQGTRDHVRVAILTLSEPERIEIRTHTGIDDSDPDNPRYIHAGGAITMHGTDGTTEVDLEGPLRHYMLETPESFDEARAAIRASLNQLRLAPATVTAPLLASMYRAPLGAADFVPHIVGPTGAGKTQLAALALQHYGPGLTPDGGTLAWSSTANYLEAVLFHAKDAPVLTDDFNPTGNNVNAYYQAAERVIRSVGNQAGRGRMNADSSLRETKTPRGLMISTGEDLPRGHSLRARMLIAELEPYLTDWHAVTIAQQQATAGLPAKAMAGYIQWLLHGLNVKREAWREAYLSERTALQELAPHGRTADMGGQLLATLTLLQEYALVIEAIPPAELAEYITEARAGIIDTVLAQADLQAAADPVDRFMSLLDSLMSSGAAHVANRDGAPPVDAEEYGWREVDQGINGLRLTAQGKRIGWLAGPDLWLDPQAAFSEAQALAVRQNDALPMSQQTLWKRMAERGLIQTEVESGKTRYSLKRERAGKRARVIVLPAYSTGRGGASGAQSEESRPTQQELRPTSLNKVGHWWGASNLKWGAESPASTSRPTSEEPRPTNKTEWGAETGAETPSQTQPAPSAPLAPLPVGETAATDSKSREVPT